MTNKSKIISVLIVSFLVVLVLKTFVIEGLIVNGDSMSPTIESGDYVFINKLSYVWSIPKRGDIVVVKPRVDVGNIIKRIIGMPGERLEVIDNKVTVREGRNDEPIPLAESYLNGVTTNAVGTTNIQIDPFQYFVLGDNRQVSIDSRELGPVDIYSIKGKPFLIINLKTMKFRVI